MLTRLQIWGSCHGNIMKIHTNTCDFRNHKGCTCNLSVCVVTIVSLNEKIKKGGKNIVM